MENVLLPTLTMTLRSSRTVNTLSQNESSTTKRTPGIIQREVRVKINGFGTIDWSNYWVFQEYRVMAIFD